MRIAYVISAYRRPEHLARLVHRLADDDVRFFVHVDSKTDDSTYRRIVAGVDDLDTVAFLERHACHWGGFGHVQASLKGLAAIVQGGVDPDYVILLSGQDYPIKPNRAIREFLRERDGRSSFMHFPLPTPNWAGGGVPRYRDWHLRWRGPHVRLPLRRGLPLGLTPWGGSAYWIISRSALETVHDFVTRHPEYVRFFHHVDIPDELFFQTILLNSAVASECDDIRLHYTEWGRTPAPAILIEEDYPHLVESPCLFARKFDPEVDARVLDLIDENLLAWKPAGGS
ncbi:MAG: beta-1,6-N-acetylglucosaminyltransferase [Gaiellaceae bacterium]